MLNHDDFVIGALQEYGLVTRESLDRAAQHAAERRIGLTDALVATGALQPRDLAIVRATICECPFVDLSQFDIDIRNSARLPRSVAERCLAFPLFDLGQIVTVAMADPLDLKAVDQIRSLLKADVEPVLCEPQALRSLIGRAYSLSGGAGAGDHGAASRGATELTTGEEPAVAAVNHILAQAIDEGASDVHISPDERELELRFRIDGMLQPRQGPGLAAHGGLVQRLKVMANLDLTQTRRPQDGKFRFVHAGRNVDIRLSIIPTVCGENAVLRLLGSASSLKGFADLGLSPVHLRQVEEAIASPHGMVLVTGPTGSGKTTTLYTALARIGTPERNVMTIEDPVEIRLPHVRQVQVNTEIGLSFAGALRSILRQDPDVVLVGEIRDEETARIAVQAALTGHLVLTTLHTNDAAGALPRLCDLGCPAFAISASLLCSIAQRLLRRVCPDCARPAPPSPALAARFGLPPGPSGLVRGAGCARCANTGFRGRVGAFEILQVSPGVQRALGGSASGAAIRAAALADGMAPMWKDGLAKARLGLTTLEEVSRVIAVDLGDADVEPPAEPAARRASA